MPPIPVPTPGTSPTPDTFDTPSHWLSSPDLAFASWIAHQRYRASSRTVYVAMFGKLVGWLDGQGIALEHLDPPTIGRFLDESGIHTRHRGRYLKVIERAFLRRAAHGLPGGLNPGRQAALLHHGVGSDAPTQFLSVQDRRQVVDYVDSVCREARKGVISREQEEEWRLVRDCALVAVMLGGGAKVSEVRRLEVGRGGVVTVNCMVSAEGFLSLKGGGGKEHRTRLFPWAVEALSVWLRVRDSAQIPGRVLFPSSRSGRSPVLGRPMHPASIFRRTQAVLEASGVTLDGQGRLCAQTLRNAFIASLIDESQPDSTLVEYLGLDAFLSAQRLRAAYGLFRTAADRSSAKTLHQRSEIS